MSSTSVAYGWSMEEVHRRNEEIRRIAADAMEFAANLRAMSPLEVVQFTDWMAGEIRKGSQ
jgi:hypothetical protein